VEENLVHVGNPPNVLSGDVALARESLDLSENADVGVDPAGVRKRVASGVWRVANEAGEQLRGDSNRSAELFSMDRMGSMYVLYSVGVLAIVVSSLL
jgi:hypothetical protein